jgi:transcriptional regulator with XRE-family HTH domain
VSEFAKLLSDFRKRAGISQYALAKKIDMNPGHLNRIEKGERNAPKRNTILKISEVLGLREEEKAELLIKARYAPPAVNIGKKCYQISESLVYESPLEGKEIAKMAYSSDISNPTVRLLAEVLSDPSIPPKRKSEMEREITSFVEWLRDKTWIGNRTKGKRHS